MSDKSDARTLFALRQLLETRPDRMAPYLQDLDRIRQDCEGRPIGDLTKAIYQWCDDRDERLYDEILDIVRSLASDDDDDRPGRGPGNRKTEGADRERDLLENHIRQATTDDPQSPNSQQS